MFRLFKRRKDQLETTEHQPSAAAGVKRVEAGLADTRKRFASQLHAVVADAEAIDENLLEALETVLLTADLGIAGTTAIIDRVRAGVKNGVISTPAEVLPAVQAELYEMIEPCEQFLAIDASRKPFVILMVGVNGAGKTTTIGKLARRYLDEGLSVMLAAGDTFRAAAVEQLQAWGERHDVPVVAQRTGADAAAVLFDAMQSAKARGVDVLIADTAGRLHTQDNLMEELKKIRRVLGRVDESAPHETLLVVDANTGQNALSQARQFLDAVDVTGIVVTKLDGTARGGVLFGIAEALKIPIRFIGVGEAAEDLRPFDAGAFVHAVLPLD